MTEESKVPAVGRRAEDPGHPCTRRLRDKAAAGRAGGRYQGILM